MSKFSLQFAIFLSIYFILMYYFTYLKEKGCKMSIIIKNAESMFERFESKMERWAEKLF